MKTKTNVQNFDEKTLEYLSNDGKFNSQLTQEEKKQLKKEQEELEKMQESEEGFAI